MMNCTKYCSKCRKYKPDDNYGLKKNGREYRTCMTCRNTQPPTSSTTSSSSSTFSSTYASSSSRPTNCLLGCVNPNDGLYHKRCPNYRPPPTSFEDVLALNRGIAEREEQRTRKHEDNLVWKKRFLNKPTKNVIEPPLVRPGSCTFNEICDTLKYSGFTIYTKEDVRIRYFSPLDFDPIHTKLRRTKSIFIYELSHPKKDIEEELCEEILEMSLRGTPREPTLILLSFDESKGLTSCLIPYINIYKNFVSTEKLKNQRRCNICNLKKKCFRKCFQCNEKYCIDCFNNYHDLRMKSCPYCRYKFCDHIDYMLRSMVSKDAIGVPVPD